MAGSKTFVFDPRDLLMLLTHYMDGVIPLDSTCNFAGFNPYLNRYIGLSVDSKEWTTMEPLHIRYDGRKILSWSKKDGDEMVWEKTPDTPGRQ